MLINTAEKAVDVIRDASRSVGFVIAQLGQSLDGRIALPSGESKYINGPQALDHLHRLRSAVDAVVVGIGTVLADDPLLTVRRVPGKSPNRVIIDRNARLSYNARVLLEDHTQVYVIRKQNCAFPVPPRAQKLFVANDEEGFDCRRIVAALRQQGMHKILIEGGAETVSRFIEHHALDRLHVLVSPVILGAGKTGINLAAVASLQHCIRAKAQIYPFEGGDVLFDLDLRRC
jgi:riboflavin-specific deaminase-like protein